MGMALALRASCRIAPPLLLTFGVLILVIRVLWMLPAAQLTWILACPFAWIGIAGCRAWRQRPKGQQILALLDHHQQAGGLLMAADMADTSAWPEASITNALPRVRWLGRQTTWLLCGAVMFVLAALLIPDRQLRWRGDQQMHLGQLVQEIQAKIEALEEERIVDEETASDYLETLEQLQRESKADEPAHAWEALDQIQALATDKAEQSAEEALARLTELSQAETLTAALAQLPEAPHVDVASLALTELRELAGSTNAAGDLSEVLAKLNSQGLSKEALQDLANALGSEKLRLARGLTNLANLRLIDPKLLGKCAGACKGGNTNALATFLSQCTSTNDANALFSLCRGGISRGRGDAPMTWADPATEENTAFKDRTLPAGPMDLQKAELVAVSRTAPEAADPTLPVGSGALAEASAGGGAAYAQRVLPRHRHAVDRYFKRESQTTSRQP